jgi:predicted O-methyltransferase YrrM
VGQPVRTKKESTAAGVLHPVVTAILSSSQHQAKNDTFWHDNTEEREGGLGLARGLRHPAQRGVFMKEIDLDDLLQDKPLPGYEGLLGRRRVTMATTCELLREARPKTMVETGCQHTTLLDAHGASTLTFGALAKKLDARLYTVDIDDSRLQQCRRLTAAYGGHIRYVCSDSVAFLSAFEGDIDFLFLDSLDFLVGTEEQSRLHQLREIQAAYPRLRDGAFVLLDDANVQPWFSWPLNSKDVQGKTFYTHRFLLEQGAECLFDLPHYQRLYRVRRVPAA